MIKIGALEEESTAQPGHCHDPPQSKHQWQYQQLQHLPYKRRKMSFFKLPLKWNRRRFYLCLKVVLLFVVFGLYFMLLLRQSMTALSTNRNKINGRSEAHKAPANARSFRSGKKGLAKHQRQPSPIDVLKPGIDRSGGYSNHSTLNPVYEYSEEMNAAAEADFNDRRSVLWNVCAEHRIIGKYSPNAWEFFISPGHGLAWCSIFKAGSSAWMYYFNLLGGYDTRFLQRTRASPIDLARRRFPRPRTSELNDNLANTISFLIVREPFERLVSAYRDKLEGSRNTYYRLLGQQIVTKFRKKVTKFAQKQPKGPTFREFLQFLVSHYKSGGRFDEHWSPVYSFCTPCSINFTLIAKVETLQRDSEYIIRQAGLETLLLNKLPQEKARAIENRSATDTRNVVSRYFSQIDEQLLTEVLEIYQLDFELFGYNSTKYYSYVQDSFGEEQQ